MIFLSYMQLWQPFNLVEWNQLCSFGRGHNEEHFCEIVLSLFVLILNVPVNIFS